MTHTNRRWITGSRWPIVAACVVLAWLVVTGCVGSGNSPVGSVSETATATASPTPAPTATETARPQILHLLGYDITSDGYLEWLREDFDITRVVVVSGQPVIGAALFPAWCPSLQWSKLTAQGVVNALTKNPIETFIGGTYSPPGNATLVPGQQAAPADALVAAQMLIDLCIRVVQTAALANGNPGCSERTNGLCQKDSEFNAWWHQANPNICNNEPGVATPVSVPAGVTC